MEEKDFQEKFGDIWLRARHNALANLIAAEEAAKYLFWTEVFVALLIIAPLASIILAQEFCFFEKWNLLITVIGSLGALFFTLIGSTREKQRMENYHRRAHMHFNNIAQKSRRGDILDLETGEHKHLLRSLEEMFETAKNNSYEPTNEQYNKAMGRIKNMPKLPFGINLCEKNYNA
ncbi:hypothetical protein [Marinomonas shanghaiensis]|uniref:hypothetical protein n=1 Tax=Marinomonas shanghaiensis TaxID=2202418 RepID=UPI003A8ECC56